MRDTESSKSRRSVTGVRSLRLVVAALCVGFLTGLWVSLWLHLNYDRERTLLAAESENSRLTRSFEEHVVRTIRAADLTLREIEQEYSRFGTKLDLGKFVKEREVYRDPYSTISILDETGNVVVSNLAASVGGNFNKNDNVRYHREHNTQELFISTPRLGTASKKWSIFLSHRINKADGSHAGNSSLALDPFYFTNLYGDLDLAPGSSVTLFGRDGIVRARMADGQMTAGQDARQATLFTKYLPMAASGHFRDTSTIDGVRRLYSYRALKDYPLVVGFGVSEPMVLGPYLARRNLYLAVAGTASVLILLFSFAAFRQIDKQAKLTAQLSASEERFDLAIRATNDGIWDWNPATKEDYLSPRWKEILGFRDDELANHESSFFDLIHADDKTTVEQAMGRHLEKGEPYEVEFRLRHKDGSYRWILSRGEALRDLRGNVVRMVGSITDLTERKRSEVELRESEERLRLALRAAGQGLFDLDLTTGVATVSPEYATMIGYDPASFEESNAKWAERLHPDDREKVYATYLNYIGGDLPNYEVEFRQKTKSGDWLWTLSIGSIVSRDANGKPLRMLGTHTDITERKRAEMERSELLAVLESSLNEIYIFDAESLYFRYVNAGALRNLGYTAEKMETLTPLDLKPEFNETSFRAMIAPLLKRQQEKIIFHTYHRRADGSSYPVEVHLQSARHQGRQVFFAVILDITPRKLAEDQIKASLAEKETLLREIHHRVKNNLAVVSSLLSLQARSVAPDTAQEALRESQERVQAMALVHEQLYRSQDLNAIDFGAHIKELGANVATSYGRVGRGIVMTMAVEEVMLDIDVAIPASLIFNELLSNAFKHGYPGGRSGKIAVSLQRDGARGVVLGVSDDGVGLPKGFDWESAPTLGLRLVRNLTEQIHGKLTVSCEHGSVFQLSLPATETALGVATLP